MAQTENELMRLEDELKEQITDPIRESTVHYYKENKDKVCVYIFVSHIEIADNCVIYFATLMINH